MITNSPGDFNLPEYRVPKKDHIVNDTLKNRHASDLEKAKKQSYIDIIMR